MNIDLSIWHLIMGASPLVKVVMLLLIMASVFSWTYIFQRYRYYREQSEALDYLENLMRREEDPEVILSKLSRGAHSEGIGRLIREGIQVYTRTSPEATYAKTRLHRTIQNALSRAVEHLQTHLSFLATVGSVSPYVGLFGTVWGIMNALRALGSVQQATLALVAPGMAEALIATAMGLFAAIPAAIAFNRYTHSSQALSMRYEAVAEHFCEILQMAPRTALENLAHD